MKTFLLATTMLVAIAGPAFAQSGNGQVKIGILNDQSSSFSALGGPEVIDAVKLAIEDFGGTVLGKPIELVSADHQNKPDIGLAIAREWVETQDVDVIMDMANSAIALGVNTLLGEKKKLGLFVSPITDRPVEADCNGYVSAWAYDAYSVARSSAQAQLAAGKDTWFVLSPDYEAGKVLENTVKGTIEESGGKIVGAVRAPLGTTDFSSYILQAQASGAKVIMLTLNGPELVNALKQIQEFGIVEQGQAVGVTILHQADVRAIGLDTLKGIQVATPWFWSLDDESRHFAEEMKKRTGHEPGWVAAGNYSAAMNYLKAVQAAGTDDADAVRAKLGESEINDFFVRHGTLRKNGRLAHDMYLVQVNAPDSSEAQANPEDAFKLVATVPADKAFRPAEASACTIK
ncbi:MAG: ABC transporter substrate-binding protein [Devosia nanyangense]|uniref:ABC transporter substrate-binding protein n=1 Tax=Devosia nanyangense TaxID=1228055 RepID=A0A933L143_9HYPH|nr:ABC transporter substrate-binding protein [Devosia nanyangense]